MENPDSGQTKRGDSGEPTALLPGPCSGAGQNEVQKELPDFLYVQIIIMRSANK